MTFLSEAAARLMGNAEDELFSKGVPRERILVVDGRSSDGTAEIASQKGVKVVFQKGEGKADALKSALDHVDTENIVVMDGDYTYPADYVCSLVEALSQGHDLAIGVRKNAEKGSQGLIYRFGNWVLTSFFNALFGTRLSDVLSGMYAVKREVLEEMFFESKGFGIESEIAAHVASSGGSIAEIPISYRKRVGEKKLKSIHGFGIAATMLRLSWRYNPVFFIFILGSLIAIPGLILGAYVAYNLLFLGINYYFKGLVAIFLTLAGVQLFVAALISLYMKRLELRIIKAVRKKRRT